MLAQTPLHGNGADPQGPAYVRHILIDELRALVYAQDGPEGLNLDPKGLYLWGWFRADHTLLGTCGLQRKRGEVEFNAVYVIPAYRGRGLARTMAATTFQTAVLWAWADRHGKLTVTCTEKSEGLFRSMGFVDLRRFPHVTKLVRNVTLDDCATPFPPSPATPHTSH